MLPTTSNPINHRELYRLPWSISDNAISWLEPTAQCNLACDGCYRENRKQHKPFEVTLRELDVFDRFRRSDSLSIAGGDPLLYPDLVRTVAEAKRRGYKPVVNTNGQALSKELLHELKKAGLSGFTFHVDSKQGRAGKWRGKNEVELCELRDELAEMAAEIDVSCSFNSTVYPDTMHNVGPLLEWAAKRIDKVHVMVFILYRDVVTKGFTYFNGDQELPISAKPTNGNGNGNGNGKEGAPLVYNLDTERAYTTHVSAADLVNEIRRSEPMYRPCAYLNGTQDPSSVKWLVAARVGRPGKVHGYAGAKFMEIIQTAKHLTTDRYLSYVPNWMSRAGKSALLLSAFDSPLRGAVKNFAVDSLTSPIKAARERLHFQGVLIIQPIDMLDDGRMNMCDGCPDITVWNDELVWSCRLDEQEKYGKNLWAMPTSALRAKASAARDAAARQNHNQA